MRRAEVGQVDGVDDDDDDREEALKSSGHDLEDERLVTVLPELRETGWDDQSDEVGRHVGAGANIQEGCGSVVLFRSF